MLLVRSVEEEQDEEEDKAQAANDHPGQQEAVAALNLNDRSNHYLTDHFTHSSTGH